MADHVAITAGSGTSINTDDCGAAGHVQGVKLAYSADGVATKVTADVLGLQVCPSVRIVRIELAVPGLSTTAYAINDQVGTKMTFTAASQVTGGTGQIRGATLVSRSAATIVPNLDLLMFRNNPTVTSADSGAANLTDTDLEAADYLGTIEFRTADYDVLLNNTVCAGVNKPVDFVFMTGASTSIYGLIVTRTAFTLANAADAITITLRIAQD